MIQAATAILQKEKTLKHVKVPIGHELIVVGDLHGQLFDLLDIFRLYGLPRPDRPFIFNGDFVDRGSYSAEVMILLAALKVAYPEHVHLARGNHEAHDMNVPYGFAGEVAVKYGLGAYRCFQGLFEQLPWAHVVNSEVIVVHGGLPRGNTSLAELEALDRVGISRNRRAPNATLYMDLLWADPDDRHGLYRSRRGAGIVTFGPDITARFLEANGLRLLIRSHEMKDDGYEWAHGGKCLTVFSAPNYADAGHNYGAVVRLKASPSGMLVDPEVFESAKKPGCYVPAMTYSPMNPSGRLTRDVVESLMAYK